jgi:hypothetical protein
VCSEEESGVVHEIDGCCSVFVVACLGVRQTGVAVDRGVQVGVTDPRLLRSGFPPLGSFGLVGPAAVGTPTAAVRDSSDFLHIDMDHLTRAFRNDGLRFSGGFAVRVDEPATIQTEVPQDSRDRSTSNGDAVGAQLECDP